MTQFNDKLYFPQLFDNELANFLSTRGLDVLLILHKNDKPMRTVDLSVKLQYTSNIKRTRSGGIGLLSYYLKRARNLRLIESKKVSIHKHTLNKLTPRGIGIVNSIINFDKVLIGIEQDGQINLLYDYKPKLRHNLS
tara:strand:- start:734 stop:1144 length:411 start_codon:yes stop_codon:yes gene_type:complete